jgi:hypothetical protein
MNGMSFKKKIHNQNLKSTNFKKPVALLYETGFLISAPSKTPLLMRDGEMFEISFNQVDFLF